MKIRYVENRLIITSKTKTVKGDWICGLQVGYKSKRVDGLNIERKYFIQKHDGTASSKLLAICHGSEKILFKFWKFNKL